jgi:hypothetical protein
VAQGKQQSAPPCHISCYLVSYLPYYPPKTRPRECVCASFPCLVLSTIYLVPPAGAAAAAALEPIVSHIQKSKSHPKTMPSQVIEPQKTIPSRSERQFHLPMSQSVHPIPSHPLNIPIAVPVHIPVSVPAAIPPSQLPVPPPIPSCTADVVVSISLPNPDEIPKPNQPGILEGQMRDDVSGLETKTKRTGE